MNKTSYINAIISISIVSFFIALFSLVYLHSNNLSEIVNEEMDILIEFQKDAPQEKMLVVEDRLKEIEGVQSATIQLTTKDQALEIMKSDLGEDFLLEGMENPFADIISFNLKSAFYRTSYIDSLKTTILQNESVDAVFYNDAFDKVIEKNVRKLSVVGLIMALLFGVFAIAIIYNTIKIALMTDHDKIKTMRLVGAKDDFIQKPYLSKMTRVGLSAGLIAIGLMALLLISFVSISDEFSSFLRVEYILLSGIVALMFSLVISWLSSKAVMHKYLQISQIR